MSNELAPLIARLRQFRDERGWRDDHTPKELAISVAIEAGELLARFQWRTGAKIDARDEEAIEAIREEMADVMIYLTQLADELGIDLVDAAFGKIDVNEGRFPPVSTKTRGEPGQPAQTRTVSSRPGP